MNNPIFDDYPDLVQELNQVYVLINQRLQSSEEKFTNLITSIFNENSKMIRPALCLIGASYNKKVLDKAISLAAAIEMMHVASLVHDDIIDQAKLRRNQPTINSQFDDGYAVICGDYLFAKAYEIVIETQDIDRIAKMSLNLTTLIFGEVEQYLDRYNEEINVERYLSIINKKTATFLSTSLVLGAHLAKIKAEEIDILDEVGHAMGMLFQIQDDLLDFETIDQIGKSSKSDVLRGTYSLPIIIAIEENNELKQYLKDNKTNLDYDYFMEQILKTNALSITENYIDEYHQKCLIEIDKLSNQDVQEKLRHLVSKLMKRKK